jgi:hypothetical protein
VHSWIWEGMQGVEDVGTVDRVDNNRYALSHPMGGENGGWAVRCGNFRLNRAGVSEDYIHT